MNKFFVNIQIFNTACTTEIALHYKMCFQSTLISNLSLMVNRDSWRPFFFKCVFYNVCVECVLNYHEFKTLSKGLILKLRILAS